jgi:hypothetical protein
MKHTDIFAQRGVALTNKRWSWGGFDRDGKVHLNMWADRFEGGQYVFPPNRGTKNSRNELITLIKHALEHNDGRFGAVMSRAEDVRAMPRKVASSRSVPDMRVIEFDEHTGAFKAIWA